MKKLPMLKSASNMLVCAEDLGMIPACVPDVIEETSIIGLRVQRMPVRLFQNNRLRVRRN